jgi:secreted trypsin-like serine protease
VPVGHLGVRSTLNAALVLVLAGSSTPERDEPAAVGALVRDGAVGCSGTLIGRRTVLTSAHCVSADPRARLTFVLPASRTVAEQRLAVDHARLHPSFDLSDPFSPRHDVALYVLAGCAPVMRPLPLADRPLGEGDVGKPLEWIGFGEGRRRSHRLPFTLTGGDWLFSDATDGRAIQVRDSGGAVVRHGWDGPHLVGVVQGSDRARHRGGVAIRIDTNRDWIDRELARAETGCDGALPRRNR